MEARKTSSVTLARYGGMPSIVRSFDLIGKVNREAEDFAKNCPKDTSRGETVYEHGAVKENIPTQRASAKPDEEKCNVSVTPT